MENDVVQGDPLGYLRYIVATGAQHIDTGFIPSGQTTVDLAFEPLQISANNCIFCSRAKASGTDPVAMALFTIKNTNYRYDHYGKSTKIIVDDIIAKQIIRTTTTSITVGSASATIAESTTASPVPLYLLASVSATGTFSNYAKCRLFYCKIYNNGVLVRDLKPYDKNGVIGMLDALDNTFYPSATGTGFLSPDNDPGKVCDLTVHVPLSFGKGDVLNCPYKGAGVNVNLKKGTYKLEVWGAQGGYRSSTTYGGKGGYSVGTVVLNGNKSVFLHSGGAGNTGKTAGGFNGGGRRGNYNGGGGGSDIRIGQDSLYARVIVAGGGGSDGSSSRAGGAGGGTAGQTNQGGGYGTNKGPGNTTYSGSSSSTTASSQSTTVSGSSTAIYGGFGFGGNGQGPVNNGYGGAGGGGWYGGSGTQPDSSGDDDKSGSGGSGYVYTSSTASQYPSGCLLDSSMYLSGASTVIGTSSFLGPDGSSETGHSGNGYCRITVIDAGVTASWVVDGSVVREDTLSEGDPLLSPPDASKTGYDLHWQVDGVTIDPSTYVMPANDITITAVYTAKTIHITYYDSGVLSHVTGTYGGVIDLPTGSNGTGRFVGWWDGSGIFASTYTAYRDTVLIARYDLIGSKLTLDSVSLQPNPVEASATVLLAVTAVVTESPVPRWSGKAEFTTSDGLPMSSPYQIGIWDTSEGDPMAVFAGKGIKSSGRDVPPLEAQTVPLPRCGVWSAGISNENGEISFSITGTVSGGPYTSSIVMLTASDVNVAAATISYDGGSPMEGQCNGSRVEFSKGTYQTFTINISRLTMSHEHVHVLNIAPGGSE